MKNSRENSTVSLKEERTCKSGFFMNPLFMYFKQIQGLIKEKVATFIKENGARHDPSRSAKVLFPPSSSFLIILTLY